MDVISSMSNECNVISNKRLKIILCEIQRLKKEIFNLLYLKILNQIEKLKIYLNLK